MHWLQAITQVKTQHKYAINAAMLGDAAEYAWSNLGYWNSSNQSYPHACRQLADQLARSVDLNSKDFLLDLGCGQGASLLFWQQQYLVKHIEAVELQSQCVDKIRKKLSFIQKIYCESFLKLKQINFEFKFDVVLCIDAAYHSNLNSFLVSICSVLNSKGRIAFHYLVLTEKFQTLNSFQKLKLQGLLKSADVKIFDLNSYAQTQAILKNNGFRNIQIQNISGQVLGGFAEYMQARDPYPKGQWRLDAFKIQMTAKLCRKLYADGLVDYVQISAERTE